MQKVTKKKKKVLELFCLFFLLLLFHLEENPKYKKHACKNIPLIKSSLQV